MIKISSLATAVAATLIAASMAGCGGSYGAASTMYQPPPNPSPTPQSTVPLTTATLNGAAGFVTGSGFAVYVFDADLPDPGQSNCNGTCAQNWPPMHAPNGALPAPWSSIMRQDGSHQLTYNGRPLYTFAGDPQPHQANGDGLNAFGGIWHVARPQ
jgi:predicted lipoprotein with Yx(FWY)xxD motif